MDKQSNRMAWLNFTTKWMWRFLSPPLHSLCSRRMQRLKGQFSVDLPPRQVPSELSTSNQGCLLFFSRL